MIEINLKNETAPLQSVILGVAQNNGGTPLVSEVYDPKSLEHVKAGTYPVEEDMCSELEGFLKILQKYSVKVYRPRVVPFCNQIFTRDIGFVVENMFIKSNILPNRGEEIQAIDFILEQINSDSIINLPEDAHIEGGDVILWGDYIFIGVYSGSDYSDLITARTNLTGAHFIKGLFPNKKVKIVELIKSNSNPRANALHLDCCFQPIGLDKAIIYKEGFIDSQDYDYLVALFGIENLFHISQEEMYLMYSNVFSIGNNIVVSESNFTRLNDWLRKEHFVVEEIPFAEIAKQEGLLRCVTLPLKRM